MYIVKNEGIFFFFPKISSKNTTLTQLQKTWGKNKNKATSDTVKKRLKLTKIGKNLHRGIFKNYDIRKSQSLKRTSPLNIYTFTMFQRLLSKL